MTACVNNENKAKGGALSGKVARTFLAGALAATMVPSVAFAAPAEEGAQVLATAPDADAWESGTFTWNVAADKYGDYYVEVGKDFYLKSVTDVYGQPVSMSDVTVVYVNGTGRFVTDPTETVGSYTAFVLDGAYKAGDIEYSSGKIQLTSVAADGGSQDITQKAQKFEVEAKSLEGSAAYEGVDVSDVSFKTLGNAIYVSFKDAEGRMLEMDNEGTFTGQGIADNGDVADLAKFNDSKDVVSKPSSGISVSYTDDAKKGSVKITETNGNVAGDYKVVIRGANDYAGEWTTVSFTINPIDLEKDTFTVAPIKKGTSAFISGVLQQTSNAVYVNGEPLADDAVTATAIEVVDSKGTVTAGASYAGATSANVTLSITKNTSGSFVKDGETGKATVQVVDDLANVTYDGIELSKYFNDRVFVTSQGQSFDESLFKATAGGKSVPVEVSLTKDGKDVDSCTEPGTYEFTAVVEAPESLEFAAVKKGSFTVIGTRFSAQPKTFVQIDGKDTNTVEYDGEAVVPNVVAKDGDKTLVAGTDYEVSFKDADGNAVESVVEPGDYTMTVDFKGAQYLTSGAQAEYVENVEFDFTVTKASLESAVAGQSVYAYTGKAVTPTFTAYTDKGCKGLSVEVDPAKTGVTYYKAALADVDKDGDVEPFEVKDTTSNNVANYQKGTGIWAVDGDPVAASDLKEEGFYVATVNAPADDAHVQGSAVQAALFEISETAQFSDVDANAWYADVVYKARDNGYMSGIAGTKLFMPEAGITRSEIACVMFNMAGQAPETDKTFPTDFSDAAADAWYSQAVFWASQAEVMNGYAGTDLFGVSDKTTREQVAAIFYNYAKSQGKDVSVKDVDGTLAKYADGSQVSPWMREAVAWAVENGVMGNGTALSPLEDVTRAQVAAMAVNFQPEALK